MNQNLTEIVVLMDRSGSMSGIAKDMCGGFDTLMQSQRSLNVGECRVTLVQFDAHVGDSLCTEVVYEARKVDDVPTCKLIPRGSTPLHDALHDTITRVGERLHNLAEAARPGKVIFVVITDGEENASRKHTLAEVRALVEQQQRDYKWEFVFLGANLDAMQEGMKLGVSAINTITYKADSVSTSKLYRNLGQTMSDFRAGRSATMAFTDDQRKDVLE